MNGYPPLVNENSQADVATVAYVKELEAFNANVRRRQREIESEGDEQRREVLQRDLDEYKRDVLPLLNGIRRTIERMRADERPATDLAASVIVEANAQR